MRTTNAISSRSFFSGVRKVKAASTSMARRSRDEATRADDEDIYSAHTHETVNQMANVRRAMSENSGAKSTKYRARRSNAKRPAAAAANADSDGDDDDDNNDDESYEALDEDEAAVLDVAGELGLVASSALAGAALEQQMQTLDAGYEEHYAPASRARRSNLQTSHQTIVYAMMESAVTPVAAAEADAVLSQLRVEPATDAERASLFEMYEASHQTVEKARKDMFEFWAEVEPDFADHAAVGAKLAADIKKLDSQENMGIQFIPGQWFVFGMCRKVSQNVLVIDRILASIRTKLELLGSQDECPICLESFVAPQERQPDDDGAGASAGGAGEDKQTVTLGCAHMVCAECWEQWKAAQERTHARAFCPLCRNDEFLQYVASHS